MIIHANQLGISPTLFYGTLNIRTVDENYFRMENRLYPRLFFVHPLGDNDALVLGFDTSFQALCGRTIVDGVRPSDRNQLLSALTACVSAKLPGLGSGPVMPPIDVTSPGAPVINTLVETSGGVNVAGMAEPLSSVTVLMNTVTKTTNAAAGGGWAVFYTHSEAGTGSKTLLVTARDAAGNVSSGSTRTITVTGPVVTPPTDTTSPVEPVINVPTESATHVLVSGTAEASSVVTISLNGNMRTVNASASTGAWSTSFLFSESGTGAKTILVTATDAAGNVSVVGTRNYTVLGPVGAPVFSEAQFREPFSADSPWKLRPVNPVLDTWQIPDDIYQPTTEVGSYSVKFYRATASDGPRTVYARAPRNGIGHPDLGKDVQQITFERFPADAVPAPSTDGHMDFVDEVTGVIHSLFAGVIDGDGRYTIDTYGWTKIGDRGWPTGAHYYQGVRAVGVPPIAGLIRTWEVQEGVSEFNHALAMTLAGSGLSGVPPGYIYPAGWADSGYESNTGQIPEGALMMLPPGFDAEALTNPDSRKIARTLKTRGAYVIDRNVGTPFSIYVELGTQGFGNSGQWEAAYNNDMVAIKNALRRVMSVDGWLNNEGLSVSNHADGVGINLMSLRGGDWYVADGTAPAPVYNTYEQRLEWGPTDGSYNLSMTYGAQYAMHTAWGKFVPGRSYRFAITAGNGAKLALELVDSNMVTLVHTQLRGHGEEFIFEVPANDHDMRLFALADSNAASSWVKVDLTKLAMP